MMMRSNVQAMLIDSVQNSCDLRELVNVANEDGCCYIAAAVMVCRANWLYIRSHLSHPDIIENAKGECKLPLKVLQLCSYAADDVVYQNTQKICHRVQSTKTLTTFGGYAVPFFISLFKNPSVLFASTLDTDTPLVRIQKDAETDLQTLVVVGESIDMCTYQVMQENMLSKSRMHNGHYHYCGVLCNTALRATPTICAGHVLFMHLCQTDLVICDSNKTRCCVGAENCSDVPISDIRLVYHIWVKIDWMDEDIY